MKKILLLFLLFGFFPAVKADSFCTLRSESEHDVTLEMHKPYGGLGVGTLSYKNEPEYLIQIGISNGYGGQYYHLKNYDPNAIAYDSKLKYHYLEHQKLEKIGYGPFVNFVGNQLARSTPKGQRTTGTLKAFMPNLASLYYYSLSGNTKKGEYGRFNLSTKMKSILNASEGFFIDSGGCRKYFAYRWD